MTFTLCTITPREDGQLVKVDGELAVFSHSCIANTHTNKQRKSDYRAILITKNCDMKTHVPHCVSSLLRKLAMLALTKKIVKFLEELCMLSLLVQPFPACYLVRAKASRKESRGMWINNEPESNLVDSQTGQNFCSSLWRPSRPCLLWVSHPCSLLSAWESCAGAGVDELTRSECLGLLT